MSGLQYKCTKLSVIQGLKEGSLGGPFQTEFTFDDISVSISQHGVRNIVVTSNLPLKSDKLIQIFQDIDKLLMLFDGRFYIIEDATVYNDVEESIDVLNEYSQKRLDCFSSRDFCQHSSLKLISFQNILTTDLYNKWNSLVSDLDIAFQVFLYALSDSKMPVDLVFAFLAELAEPFTELVKERTYYCQTLNPGERGTTLKMCVDNLIILYGSDIFANELKNNYALFLDRVVKSRVRIMHIKKKQMDYFDGKECIKYSLKFSLLYRKILLSLLDISEQQYKANVQNATKKVDEWN